MSGRIKAGFPNTAATGDAGCGTWQPLPSAVRRPVVAVALVLPAILAIQLIGITPQFVLTRMLMISQDLPVLVLTCGLLLAMAKWGVPNVAVDVGWRMLTANRRDFLLVVLAGGLTAAMGTRIVALDFGISRDEMMAAFDATIFGSGRLLAPVAPEWRRFVPALHPDFRLPVPGNVAWVSSYLPGNAMLRAGLGTIFNAATSNALILMAGLIALLGVARRLWPERPDAAAVAVILAASSSQVLGMAMTPFAMGPHLACNMIWLWLFLRGGVGGHGGAIAVGFFATGLHQILFHPLFAAPFLLHLLLERRWLTAAAYFASYGVIGVFWILWWQLVLAGHGIAGEAAGSVGFAYFAERIAGMLRWFSFYGLETMAQNLLRFAAWQNPFMLVLLVPGLAAAWQLRGIAGSMAAGIILTIFAMFILLPNQDIGWGYRYVHGFIGSAALLCALGYMRLSGHGFARTEAIISQRRALAGMIGLLTVFAVLILLPIHGLMMRGHIAPFARAQQAIYQTDADAVVVETISAYYGIDLVRNDPYLRNRPLIFDIGQLDDELVRELCARMGVRIFDGRDAGRFGVGWTDPTTHPDYARMRRLRDFIESPACAGLRRAG